MSKARVAVPRNIKDQVFKEFSHKCAICGAGNPQIHHMNEDPSDNDPDNLIPLCPNHHLTDQHNPTGRLPFHQLKLFRQYKDPTILEPEFQPLYKRLVFLFDINDASQINEVEEHSRQLAKFVSFLEMGKFYSDEIQKLIGPFMRVLFDGSPSDGKSEAAIIRNVIANRQKTLELIMELLRYQKWAAKKERPEE